MTNPMGPERPDPTFPDPSPAHPPNPDRTPLSEPAGMPDDEPDECRLPTNRLASPQEHRRRSDDLGRTASTAARIVVCEKGQSPYSCRQSPASWD